MRKAIWILMISALLTMAGVVTVSANDFEHVEVGQAVQVMDQELNLTAALNEVSYTSNGKEKLVCLSWVVYHQVDQKQPAKLLTAEDFSGYVQVFAADPYEPPAKLADARGSVLPGMVWEMQLFYKVPRNWNRLSVLIEGNILRGERIIDRGYEFDIDLDECKEQQSEWKGWDEINTSSEEGDRVELSSRFREELPFSLPLGISERELSERLDITEAEFLDDGFIHYYFLPALLDDEPATIWLMTEKESLLLTDSAEGGEEEYTEAQSEEDMSRPSVTEGSESGESDKWSLMGRGILTDSQVIVAGEEDNTVFEISGVN